MIETSAELADRVAKHFNDLVERPIEYDARHPEQIAEAYAEADGWQVFVLPFEEGEEVLDRADGCQETIELAVLVNGPLDDKVTKTDALKFVKFLRLSFRDLDDEAFDGWEWEGNEVAVLADTEALKQSHFMSLFVPRFMNIT